MNNYNKYLNQNNYHQANNNSSSGNKNQPTLQDFNFLSKIGEGSYSSVHKVAKKSDGKFYALKKVKLDSLKPKEKENALNEVRILASINHPHIISYKDTFFDERSNSLCLVMEFAEEGDLQRRVDKNAKIRQYFPESEIWKIFIHCLRGLQVLHGMKILHRDIKCANIFISKEGNYKLGDLNVSKVAKKGLVYTQTGTPYYASPEVWRDEPYDFKSDIWSLGCIIYELCALKPPFRAKNMEGLYQRVQKGVFERIPRIFSDDLFNVISLCLKVNSAMRPSTKQLINNSIVKKRTQQFAAEPSHQELNTMELQNNFNLLNTIKVPKNMRQLAQNLPKSQYEDVQNASFDNADLRNLQDKKQRQNKISSALPNYDERRRQERVKSENPKILLDNSSKVHNKENLVNLPNIYESKKRNINERYQQDNINGNQSQVDQSLPSLNQKSHLYNKNIVNNAYENQSGSKKKDLNNYHYIEGDSYSMNSQQSIARNNLSQLENQLARKERQLLGGGNKQQSQHYNNNSIKQQQYSKQNLNKYIDNNNNYNQQLQQQILQKQNQYNENSYSRIANLYENRQYMPSPISHKKAKNYTPFNPITQSNNNNIANNPNQSRPVWWG